MPTIGNLKTLLEWWPAVQMVQVIAVAKPGRDRALEVVRLVEWLSSKTKTSVDDQLVGKIKEVVMTPQGGELIDYCADLVRKQIDDNN